MRNIICFLTVKPSELFYNFCKKLKMDNYDVYICIDDNNYDIPNYDGEIKIIKINNKICEEAGFRDTVTYTKNKACSRDKALYYFCKSNIEYEYIWFIEEDVFIPDISTLLNIDNKYKTGDLLSAENKIAFNKEDSKNWNYWERVNRECKLELPYCISMICAIRCSKKLLSYINDYASKYNILFFCEILFNTIAFHNNLIIITPSELSTIHFRKNWRKDEIKKSNLYHPVKDIKKHYEFRE